MKKWLVFLLALFFLEVTQATEFTGTLIDNSDGTYSVNIETADGERQFYGNAYVQADGALTITANGQKNETYIGTANPNSDGTYTMNLKNNASGDPATGVLQTQQ